MKRNFWPHAIVGYFIVFITGVVAWVVFAVQNEDQLVRADYYDHEIRYQQQIDRVARTKGLAAPARIEYDYPGQRITVSIPSMAQPDENRATIHLYRPSDAQMDQRLEIELNERGARSFSVANLEAGLWKVQLSWTSAGKEYYLNKPVVVGSN